jgi:ubiquinone/menaquinone biosynthesis C-methylase UbiE
MRWEVVKQFKNRVVNSAFEIKKIAVVGGSQNDPEVAIYLNSSKELKFFGVDQADNLNFHFLDLNFDSNQEGEFDLVICSQVLEHIWDVDQGLKTLSKMTKPGGLIWINCPFSNVAHGSPDFFSTGYSPKLIVNLLEKYGAEPIFATQIGSPRSYFFTHTVRFWPTEKIYRRPLTPRISRFYLKKLPLLMISQFKSAKVTESETFATETIVLLKK